MSVKKTIGGHHTIVLGYLILEPGNCLEYHIFNFRDVKNWRNEMGKKIKAKTIFPKPTVSGKIAFEPDEWEEVRKALLLDKEYNNPNNSFRFVGGTDGKEH